MKTTELRIGNYIIFENEVCEISTIGKNKVGVSQKTDKGFFVETLTDIDEIEPIHLTEEWLLKFGFKANNNSIFTTYHKGGTSILIGIEDVLKFKFEDYITVVKHIHELQNIYFTLTNEELTLKQ